MNNYPETGEMILAIHRMNGNKVSRSVGVLQSGDVVIIDKKTGEKTIHDKATNEARDIRSLVKDELEQSPHTIPIQFAFTLRH